mgnify:CR=1 FL=1
MISKNISKNLLFIFLFAVGVTVLHYGISFFMGENYKVDDGTIPTSVAIIMDGNGRWAQKRKLPVSYGHKKGADNLIKILKHAKSIDIKSLTLYAFSTENWKRPKDEVDYILNILNNYLDEKSEIFMKNDIKLKFIGDLTKLDGEVLRKIANLEKETENNTLILNIAFSYGGRAEIVNATKNIAVDYKNNKIDINDINEELFKKYLYNPEIIYPDLVIRTGGDMRISNFLLWEISYSELYFTNTLWPDFKEKDFDKAIKNYKKRKRTYGERKAVR